MYGGKYYMDFVGNLLLFSRTKIFENPLKIDKVIACVWFTTFLGHRICTVSGSQNLQYNIL